METITQIPIGSRKCIAPEDIMLLEADVNYTQVHLIDGRKMIVATSLKILERRFSSCSQFFRTHKSFLININFIKQYDSTTDENFLQMKNDIRVIISRRKKKAFIAKLQS